MYALTETSSYEKKALLAPSSGFEKETKNSAISSDPTVLGYPFQPA
jgi:hypothetical protein